MTAICCGVTVIYENGAGVNTSFVTNMDDPDVAARTDSDLRDAIDGASREYVRRDRKIVAKLAFPDELITAARMNYYSAHHTDFRVLRSQSLYVRKLDNYPSGIFGAGYLLNRCAAAERAAAERAAAERAAAERAAAERAAAERVTLSDRERRILDMLSREDPDSIHPSTTPDLFAL